MASGEEEQGLRPRGAGVEGDVLRIAAGFHGGGLSERPSPGAAEPSFKGRPDVSFGVVRRLLAGCLLLLLLAPAAGGVAVREPPRLTYRVDVPLSGPAGREQRFGDAGLCLAGPNLGEGSRLTGAGGGYTQPSWSAAASHFSAMRRSSSGTSADGSGWSPTSDAATRTRPGRRTEAGSPSRPGRSGGRSTRLGPTERIRGPSCRETFRSIPRGRPTAARLHSRTARSTSSTSPARTGASLPSEDASRPGRPTASRSSSSGTPTSCSSARAGKASGR